ncbi:uncharacterized protein [Trachinotus anak]
MIGNFSVVATVLTVAFTVSLSLLSLLCLRCKRKSKVIQEENQVYHLQTFQRGGSVFAVMQSKTVTRANPITSATVETREDISQDSTDELADYENISQPGQRESLEHTYVAPLPNSVYENTHTECTTDADQTQGVYANFIQSLPINNDEDDYENIFQDDDEPDYVNETVHCT